MVKVMNATRDNHREFVLTKEDIEKALLKYIAEDIKRDDIYLIRYKFVGDDYVRVKVGIKYEQGH